MQKRLYVTLLIISFYIGTTNTAADNSKELSEANNRPTTLWAALKYGTPAKSGLYGQSEKEKKELLKMVIENPTQYPPTALEMDEARLNCGGAVLGSTFKEAFLCPTSCEVLACVLGSACCISSCLALNAINAHQRDVRNHNHPVYDHFPFSLFKDTDQK